MVINLFDQWRRLFSDDLRIDPEDHLSVFTQLMTRYGETHRLYHNTKHLREAFSAYYSVTGVDLPEVELAIWFHDAIYDPTSNANELDSAVLAFKQLTTLGIPVRLARTVASVILRDSSINNLSWIDKVFHDADYGIFSAESERYKEYARAIRREHEHMRDADFKKGRILFLELLLNGDVFLCRTHNYAEKVDVAHDNIVCEITELEAACS